MGAFGEKLRKQREQRGLDLDAISKTTKISTRMLRALEDEHFDQLPGGIFNKGFVRAYARQVGLDEDETVADYLAALNASQPLPQSLLQEVLAPAAKPTPVAAPVPADNVLAHDLPADKPADKNDDANDQNQQRRTDAQKQREDRRKQGRRNEDRRNEDRRNEDRRPRAKEQKYPAGDPDHPADHSSAPIPWGKLALALLLITLLLAVWNFRRRPQPTATSQPVPFSNQSPAPVSSPASAPTAATLPAEKSSPAPISATTTPTHTEPASSAAVPTTSVAGSASKPPTPPDANPPPAKPPALAAAPKPPGTFTLLIRAEESTWISLVADGKPVAQENLIAPAHTSVRATREIVVKAGNAAGISFLLNGKEIPARGNEGEVKTYVFDSNGLRTAPQ